MFIGSVSHGNMKLPENRYRFSHTTHTSSIIKAERWWNKIFMKYSMPSQFRRQKQFSLYYKCWKSRKSHFCFYCFLTAKQWIFYFFFHLGTISFCSLKKLFDLFLFVLPRQISKIKIIILNDVLKKKFTFVFFPFYLAIILS